MEVYVLTPELVLEAIVGATERNDLLAGTKPHRYRNFRDAAINGSGEAGAGEQETPFDVFRQSYLDQFLQMPRTGALISPVLDPDQEE